MNKGTICDRQNDSHESHCFCLYIFITRTHAHLSWVKQCGVQNRSNDVSRLAVLGEDKQKRDKHIPVFKLSGLSLCWQEIEHNRTKYNQQETTQQTGTQSNVVQYNKQQNSPKWMKE